MKRETMMHSKWTGLFNPQTDGHSYPKATPMMLGELPWLVCWYLWMCRCVPDQVDFTVTMTIKKQQNKWPRYSRWSARAHTFVCPSWAAFLLSAVSVSLVCSVAEWSWSVAKPGRSPWCAPAAGSHAGATAVRAASGTRRSVAVSAAAACAWEPPAPAAAAAPGGLQAFWNAISHQDVPGDRCVGMREHPCATYWWLSTCPAQTMWDKLWTMVALDGFGKPGRR